MKQIMSLKAFNSGQITKASQDGSWEFISLLTGISAAGVVLPPALIYQSETGDLQDTWLEDWVPEQEAFFSSSANGWSLNVFRLEWLHKIFERYTAPIAGNRRCLLLVDGHNSHVNMAFVEACNKLRILLLILPPHSTHRLQPLDIGLFSPLSTSYSKNLNTLMQTSFSLIGMSK